MLGITQTSDPLVLYVYTINFARVKKKKRERGREREREIERERERSEDQQYLQRSTRQLDTDYYTLFGRSNVWNVNACCVRELSGCTILAYPGMALWPAAIVAKAKVYSLLLDGSNDSGNIDNKFCWLYGVIMNGLMRRYIHTRMDYFIVSLQKSITAEGLLGLENRYCHHKIARNYCVWVLMVPR